MTGLEFINKCKEQVLDYIKENGLAIAPDTITMGREGVYIVWLCKTLQNHKGLFSAPIKGCPYFEFTYNGDGKILYMDVYKKEEHRDIVI